MIKSVFMLSIVFFSSRSNATPVPFQAQCGFDQPVITGTIDYPRAADFKLQAIDPKSYLEVAGSYPYGSRIPFFKQGGTCYTLQAKAFSLTVSGQTYTSDPVYIDPAFSPLFCDKAPVLYASPVADSQQYNDLQGQSIFVNSDDDGKTVDWLPASSFSVAKIGEYDQDPCIQDQNCAVSASDNFNQQAEISYSLSPQGGLIPTALTYGKPTVSCGFILGK